ncbi:major facilitator superfamily transporter [Diplodia corticola]|uniref:Major facilitator superfamily transporter n=1 Tax=Diplodia corticola TaxID=236234 RepID=A0A1J9RKR4_9PEZI|nr:major facilitator superfamily transporter [Diplodia corticola]OJD29111.1 major facilitator superfamily transporter [Diplodia corticola]
MGRSDTASVRASVDKAENLHAEQLEMPDPVKPGHVDEELEEALRNYVPGSAEEKKLLRKIDLRLMPILWIMYILNYVDRTNIGNAKIAGMEDDLNLDDQKYAWVLSIFFFGYLLCEVPSNMILSRSRPSLFLPGIMIVWGALSAAMSAAQTYGAMLAFRFVVGCIESGFFPGVLYLLSCWYTSGELGKRFTIFYTAATLSGAVGGLISGGITDGLHNAHGISGWRWLFIVEGVCTVGVAFCAMFILLDYPATSPALSLEEKQLATVRLIADTRSREAETSTAGAKLTHMQAFTAAVVDYRTWYFLVLLMLNVGSGTISYFIPTLTKTLGYDGVTAQYMTVPIYVVAALVANCAAVAADRVQRRSGGANGARAPFVAAFLALGCACAVVCAAVTHHVVRYVMTCFVAAGIWTALPLALAWISNTINAPPEKRAIVLALVNACGNLSSVYGSRIWPDRDAPDYRMGWGVTAGFLGAATVMVVISPVVFRIPFKELRVARSEESGEARVEDAGEER